MNPDDQQDDVNEKIFLNDGKYYEQDGVTKVGAVLDKSLEAAIEWIEFARTCYKANDYALAQCYLHATSNIVFDAAHQCEKWALDQK